MAKKKKKKKKRETTREATMAAKDMIESYLQEGWSEPAVLPHAVKYVFQSQKHDGSSRYVFTIMSQSINCVCVCDVAQNHIPNLRIFEARSMNE